MENEIKSLDQSGSRSFRFLLTLALRKAQLAVALDNRGQIREATVAYNEAVETLNLVLEQTSDPESNSKLIHFVKNILQISSSSEKPYEVGRLVIKKLSEFENLHKSDKKEQYNTETPKKNSLTTLSNFTRATKDISESEYPFTSLRESRHQNILRENIFSSSTSVQPPRNAGDPNPFSNIRTDKSLENRIFDYSTNWSRSSSKNTHYNNKSKITPVSLLENKRTLSDRVEGSEHQSADENTTTQNTNAPDNHLKENYKAKLNYNNSNNTDSSSPNLHKTSDDYQNNKTTSESPFDHVVKNTNLDKNNHFDDNIEYTEKVDNDLFDMTNADEKSHDYIPIKSGLKEPESEYLNINLLPPESQKFFTDSIKPELAIRLRYPSSKNESTEKSIEYTSDNNTNNLGSDITIQQQTIVPVDLKESTFGNIRGNGNSSNLSTIIDSSNIRSNKIYGADSDISIYPDLIPSNSQKSTPIDENNIDNKFVGTSNTKNLYDNSEMNSKNIVESTSAQTYPGSGVISDDILAGNEKELPPKLSTISTSLYSDFYSIFHNLEDISYVLETQMPLLQSHESVTLYDLEKETQSKASSGSRVLGYDAGVNHGNPLQPFWLIFSLIQSMGENGAYISPSLFVSQKVWYQSGVRLASIDTKMSSITQLIPIFDEIANINLPDIFYLLPENNDILANTNFLDSVKAAQEETNGSIKSINDPDESKLDYFKRQEFEVLSYFCNEISMWLDAAEEALDRVHKALSKKLKFIEPSSKKFTSPLPTPSKFNSEIIDSILNSKKPNSTVLSFVESRQLENGNISGSDTNSNAYSGEPNSYSFTPITKNFGVTKAESTKNFTILGELNSDQTITKEIQIPNLNTDNGVSKQGSNNLNYMNSRLNFESDSNNNTRNNGFIYDFNRINISTNNDTIHVNSDYNTSFNSNQPFKSTMNSSKFKSFGRLGKSVDKLYSNISKDKTEGTSNYALFLHKLLVCFMRLEPWILYFSQLSLVPGMQSYFKNCYDSYSGDIGSPKNKSKSIFEGGKKPAKKPRKSTLTKIANFGGSNHHGSNGFLSLSGFKPRSISMIPNEITSLGKQEQSKNVNFGMPESGKYQGVSTTNLRFTSKNNTPIGTDQFESISAEKTMKINQHNRNTSDLLERNKQAEPQKTYPGKSGVQVSNQSNSISNSSTSDCIDYANIVMEASFLSLKLSYNLANYEKSPLVILRRLIRISEWLNSVLLPWVLRDVHMLLIKYIKKLHEWVIN
ncbi:hypothetical protein BB559_007241 [Furculomyces boomerangus]|uniref:MIT domain-containing protein n=1 Tax=Furculomyces boomerangus TaxID=61424 RepID=A0A2T9XY88_9FUNG|nr:hypothetical protein BB559_007241 [Furculomyces boomerangus]